MRRASTLPALLAAAGGLLLAGAASAQSAPTPAGQDHGLRYLSWPGRSEATSPDRRAPTQATPVRRDLRRPNPVIPHGGAAASAPATGLTPAPGPTRRGLTPANAWLQPAPPPPQPQPQPAPAPAPVAVTPPSAPAPAPQPRPRSVPEYLPDQGGRGQPAPADIVYPSPTTAPDAGVDRSADPMAPRRDAPIFRMQQPVPRPEAPATPPQAAVTRADPSAQPHRVMDVANSGERPPQQGARYYSVHRQNGRTPDAVVMPESTYVDALVVSMAETPASQDLAAPKEGPTLIRDRNGNMRAAPAASDGDHQ